MIDAFKYPKKLPLSEKLLWEYNDCFADRPTKKLCFAFLHQNYSMDMHKHEFYEINVVVSGTGVHYSKLGSKIVKRGDVFIIPPNALHGYYSYDHLNVWHALFQESFFTRYSNDLSLASSYQILFDTNRNNVERYPIKIECSNQLSFNELESLIEKLTDSLNLEESYQVQNIEYVRSYLCGLELIIKLCELYENKGTIFGPNIEQNNKIYNCMAYFHTNYNKKIDIKELCKIACMSRTLLFKEFKRVTGLTPNDFLNDYRMKIANKLLQETDLSINEISSQVGYYDSSHFEKMYKRYFHTIPKKNRTY